MSICIFDVVDTAMIRVTIELFPKGDSSKARHLGTIDIVNVGGTITNGHYLARLSRRGRPLDVWNVVMLSGFPRKRLGAYDLLLCVLARAVGVRNKADILRVNEL